jgi:hypothetical protein
VNDGPEPAHVKSIVNRQDIHENDEPFWTIQPAENRLQPFEQRLLNVTYHPPPIPIVHGFKEQLKPSEQREDHEVAATFNGTMVSSPDDLLANIRLIGRAITPEVTLSQFTAEFIDTPTNCNTEIAVRIRNHSDELPSAPCKRASFAVSVIGSSDFFHSGTVGHAQIGDSVLLVWKYGAESGHGGSASHGHLHLRRQKNIDWGADGNR